jgi:methylmalonyl-CoA/ethylmalonyl-CoA epimerase
MTELGSASHFVGATEQVDALTFSLHHGAVSVPDLEASIQWYARVLKLHVERRFDLAAIQAHGAMLCGAGVRIELFEVPQAHPLPEERRFPDRDLTTHGNKHVALSAPDFPHLLGWLKECGVEPVLTHTGAFGTALFIRDNSGNLIEFVTPPDRLSSRGCPE